MPSSSASCIKHKLVLEKISFYWGYPLQKLILTLSNQIIEIIPLEAPGFCSFFFCLIESIRSAII